MGNCANSNSHQNYINRIKSLKQAYQQIVEGLRLCLEKLECLFREPKFTCNILNFSSYLNAKISQVQDAQQLKSICSLLSQIKNYRSKLLVLFEINDQLDLDSPKELQQYREWENQKVSFIQIKNSAVLLFYSLDVPDIGFEDPTERSLSENSMNQIAA